MSHAQRLLEALQARGLTLATAESCTGGNIAHEITLVPGCSDVFVGSVVSYANSAKTSLLGVDPGILAACGAVSREVVEQMALGATRALGADCAMATSGIAGPGGGTPDKPVGTVWTAWCLHGRVYSRLLQLRGTRAEIIAQATEAVMRSLTQQIINHEQDTDKNTFL